MSTPPPNIHCHTDNESHVFMTYTVDRLGNGGDGRTTYVFSPTPLIEVSRNILFAGKEQIGTDLVINFTGYLVAPRFINEHCESVHDVAQDVPDTIPGIEHPTLQLGYTNITILNSLMRKMSQVLSVPGGKFELYELCNNERKVFFKCYPQTITDLKFATSPDNWTTTIPYSFSMTVSRTDVYTPDKDGNNIPLYLENVSEEWSIQPFNESNSLEHIIVNDDEEETLLELHRELSEELDKPNPNTETIDSLHEQIHDLVKENRSGTVHNTGTRMFTVTHTLSAAGKTVFGLQTDADEDDLGYNSNSHGIDTFNSQNHQYNRPAGTENIHEWKRDEQAVLAQTTYDKYIAINQNNSKPQSAGLSAYDFAKMWVESKLYDTENVVNKLGSRKPTQSINDRYGFIEGSDDRVDENSLPGDPQETTDNDGSNTSLEDIFVLDEDLCFIYPTKSRGKAYNHTRQKTGNRINGTYNVTETWMLIVGQYADYGATDDYTIDYALDSKTGIDTVSINGTIQGYADGNIYWDDQKEQNTKIKNAENLFQTLAAGQVFHIRSQEFVNKMRSQASDISTLPTQKTVKKQTKEGIIQYTFNFDGRCPPLIPGAVYESFNTQTTYPTDVFGTVVIPGRDKGPLFFSANTQTAPKYTLSYEVVMQPEPCNTKNLKNPMPNAASVENDPSFKQKLQKHIIERLQDRIAPPREWIMYVVRAHYEYLKDIGWDIIRVESDSDTWSIDERRLSGGITFTGGPCSSDNYLTSVTKTIRQLDKSVPLDTTFYGNKR